MVDALVSDRKSRSSWASLSEPTDTQESVKASENAQDITQVLKIKNVCIPCTKETEVKVVWSRGKNKIKTKKTLVSPEQQMAKFNEKFQVVTKMELDEDNVPIGEKKSHINVVSDQQTGLLGSAVLDITKFGYNGKYLTHKLPLENALYEGSYIIIDISTELNMPSLEKSQSEVSFAESVNTTETFENIEQKQALIKHELANKKRECDKLKKNCEKILAQKKNELNSLQTDVENLQVNLKSASLQFQETEECVKEYKTASTLMGQTLEQKTQEISDIEVDCQNKKEKTDKSTQDLQNAMDQMEEMEQAIQVAQIKHAQKVKEEKSKIRTFFAFSGYQIRSNK